MRLLALLQFAKLQVFCLFDLLDIKMLPALLAIEPEKVFALPDHSLADNDFKLMATLSDLADRELVATIGWAKQVPGKLICLCCLSFDSYEVY